LVALVDIGQRVRLCWFARLVHAVCGRHPEKRPVPLLCTTGDVVDSRITPTSLSLFHQNATMTHSVGAASFMLGRIGAVKRTTGVAYAVARNGSDFVASSKSCFVKNPAALLDRCAA